MGKNLNLAVTFFFIFISNTVLSQVKIENDLSALPADMETLSKPQWVSVTGRYPSTLFEKTEVDLNSIRTTEDGNIEVWTRETYIEEQIVDASMSYRVAEARYRIDCSRNTYRVEFIHTRKADGALVRSAPIEELASMVDAPPIPKQSLLFGMQAKLACDHATH
jgi:hypothetical protein